jgi:hypothetical protein
MDHVFKYGNFSMRKQFELFGILDVKNFLMTKIFTLKL